MCDTASKFRPFLWAALIVTAHFFLSADPLRAQPNFQEAVLGRLPSGETLTAWSASPNAGGAVPAVIFLHGCSGLRDGDDALSLYQAWAKILLDRGYAILMIDSAGSRGLGQTCTGGPERHRMYRERPSDAYAGLRYLQEQETIDPSRIFLLGWSQGGTIALLTINDLSVGRPDPAPVQDFRAAIAFYPGACDRQTAPYTNVRPGEWRTVAPLLILMGAEDTWTPPVPCRVFATEAQARGEPVQYIEYPDAVHAFDAPDLPLFARQGVAAPGHAAPLVGTDPAARRQAIADVLAFLETYR